MRWALVFAVAVLAGVVLGLAHAPFWVAMVSVAPLGFFGPLYIYWPKGKGKR